MYRLLFRLILRRLPAELTHDFAIMLLRAITHLPFVQAKVRNFLGASDPILRTQALGFDFDTPIGLAAGFDKDAEAFPALSALGFGFIEVGTVTAQPQPGSPKPRLFRLPIDRALINRMGFNNDGALAVASKLKRRRATCSGVIVGVNIGKTKLTAAADVVDDYAYSAQTLAEHADYLVVNVSSPNTPGLRDLETSPELRSLLIAVRQATNRSAPHRTVPILLKISADLAPDQVDRIADLTNELHIDGIIATNTSVRRSGLLSDAGAVTALGPGGLSGPPLRERSLDVLRQLRTRVAPDVRLISVGGVENAEDAFERILAGATLVQAYTGFVYGGPLWVNHLNKELAELLRQRGFENVNHAVGCGTAQPSE